MKLFLTVLIGVFSIYPSFSQQKESRISFPDSTKKILIVEAACGQCQLGLKASGCDLAVRISGKSYFVDGTSINDHGDAHAEDGFCNAVRKAEVQGEIINNRFKATYFKMVKKPDSRGIKTQ